MEKEKVLQDLYFRIGDMTSDYIGEQAKRVLSFSKCA